MPSRNANRIQTSFWQPYSAHQDHDPQSAKMLYTSIEWNKINVYNGLGKYFTTRRLGILLMEHVTIKRFLMELTKKAEQNKDV